MGSTPTRSTASRPEFSAAAEKRPFERRRGSSGHPTAVNVGADRRGRRGRAVKISAASRGRARGSRRHYHVETCQALGATSETTILSGRGDGGGRRQRASARQPVGSRPTWLRRMLNPQGRGTEPRLRGWLAIVRRICYSSCSSPGRSSGAVGAYGPLAQRERAALTRRRSEVRFLHGPYGSQSTWLVERV